MKENLKEGNLHKWFKGSKSKDGKGGWVNVVTGGTCASDEPGEGTPKCVSSSKRASMSKSERLSAARRKKKADPNQQQKTGAAKPTYVATDKPKKKNEEFDMEIQESDKKGKGSGKKDACYHKVKASAKVWPSAYASGRLVQCRKKGAANYGNSKKNEEFLALPEYSDIQINSMRAAGIEVEVLDEKCWDTHKQVGMKKKGGKMVPNCVPKNEEVEVSERQRVIESLIADRAKKAVDHQRQGTHGDDHEMDKDMKSAQKSVKRMNDRMGADAAGKRSEMDVKRRFPKNEEVELEDANGKKFAEVIDVVTNEDLGITMSEAARIPQQYGNIYLVGFNWKSRYMMMRLFFPDVKKPSRKEVQEALDKIYPGCVVQRFDIVAYKPGEPMLNMGVKEEIELEEDMSGMSQKSGDKRSTESGAGMTAKGVAKYNRRTGGNLKTAVTTPPSKLKPGSKAAKRRKSFCARSRGWTGERGKAARRRWNC